MSEIAALPAPITPQQVFGNIVGISRSTEAAVMQAVSAIDRAPGMQVVVAVNSAQLMRAMRLPPSVGAKIARFYSCV